MQYTGLKDKNGREIYEGDIIRRWGYIDRDKQGWIYDEIKWEMIRASDDMGVESVGFIDYEATYPREKGIEVIGNIYENKELIK